MNRSRGAGRSRRTGRLGRRASLRIAETLVLLPLAACADELPPLEPVPAEVTIVGRVYHEGVPVGLDGASVRFWRDLDSPCELDPDTGCLLTVSTDAEGYYRVHLDAQSPLWETEPCFWRGRARLPNRHQSAARILFMDPPILPAACRGVLVAVDLTIP